MMSKYNTNKKYRECVKRCVKKYRATEKGIITTQRALKKLKDVYPDYMKDYMKKRRSEAKIQGICCRCLKRKAIKGMVLCRICRI